MRLAYAVLLAALAVPLAASAQTLVDPKTGHAVVDPKTKHPLGAPQAQAAPQGLMAPGQTGSTINGYPPPAAPLGNNDQLLLQQHGVNSYNSLTLQSLGAFLGTTGGGGGGGTCHNLLNASNQPILNASNQPILVGC